MKRFHFYAGMLALMLTCFFALPARSGSDQGKVYTKSWDLPLYESASSEGKSVAKVRTFNQELNVEERKGRWLKVSCPDGEGWVYSGNVSSTKSLEENKSNLNVKAENLTSAAAGRGGLTEEANAYAGRHNHGDVAEQIRWASKINDSITKEDARAYLKANKLGEYGEVK